MPKNIYHEIVARLQRGIDASGTMLKVDAGDLAIVLNEFNNREIRIEFLKSDAQDTLTGIKKVLRIP